MAILNCQAATIRNSWQQTYNTLISKVINSSTIVDNEFSQDLKSAFAAENQLSACSTGRAWVNAPEHEIYTFKNHFIAILSTVDFDFPLAEWDRLLPPVVITLNLLHSSHLNQLLSAHASHFVNYGYNRVSLSPAGEKVAAQTASDKPKYHLLNMVE